MAAIRTTGLTKHYGATEALVDLDVTGTEELVRVAATVRGDMDPVLRAISLGTVRDLTVEEPDLEESVLELYSRSQEEP